jgi:hypothetical protein
MTRMLPLLALCAIAGCTTMPKQTARLQESLMGQPVTALVARYGHADVYQHSLPYGTPGRDTARLGALYQWDLSKTSTYFILKSSNVSGTADGRPFDATMSGGADAYDVEKSCRLNVEADADGVVTKVSLWGTAGVCKGYVS